MPDDDKELARLMIAHFKNLLLASQPPEIMPEFADDQDFCNAHGTFMGLREVLLNFSRGLVREPIPQRGFVFGAMKALQANLEHMIWQIQQVAGGDFTQRMVFMGEFATAFNSMVTSLAAAREDLVVRQNALAKLIGSLTEEIHLRSANLLALRESEEKFKYLAEHDTLTGSLNRRSFNGRVEIEIQKAVFTGKPCALAMLDVDFFKHFNDTFGHSAGDAALKHLVKVADKNLRSPDFMGRHGGEEFVFFFADANEKDALVAAERVRKAVEADTMMFEGTPMPMTVSIGICVLLSSSGNMQSDLLFEMLLNTADAALYQAKKEGRNRCIVTPLSGDACVLESPPKPDVQEEAQTEVAQTKSYLELSKATGSASLTAALQALDVVKKMQPAAAPVTAGSGPPEQPSNKPTTQEEDEFSYFKDFE
jgi:diguanylate cyclase (GGDEF)-like protein